MLNSMAAGWSSLEEDGMARLNQDVRSSTLETKV